MNRNQIEKVLMKDEKVLYTYKPMFIKTVLLPLFVIYSRFYSSYSLLLIPASAESMEIKMTEGIIDLPLLVLQYSLVSYYYF